MEINTQDLSAQQAYKLLTGSIMPRPIAWVSTISSDGIPNLAPYSFFTAAASDPPTIVFCPTTRTSDGRQKDTFYNIQATGEFVVNFVTEALVEAMNITSVETAAEVDEFKRAGLTAVPSMTVAAPRVKESPIHFECVLHQIVTIHEGVGGGHLVIGTVQHMHFADSIYREGGYVNQEAYFPVGRMVGNSYCRTKDQFDIARPASEIESSGKG